MAVTIKDVAALAGVSPSTVSRVCNNNPAISRETQDRVRKAMAELGYESTAASDAVPQAIKMVGIILPPAGRDTFENNFYLKAIRGISQVCNQHKIASTIITGNDSEELLHCVKTQQSSGRVDGFILLYSRKNDPVIEYLCEQGVLYVMVGKPQELPGQTFCIDNDNLLAGREAADYLYDLGHRRIAFLGNTSGNVFAADRQAGYRLSLLLHGLNADPELCIEMAHVGADTTALQTLLTQQNRPTAFVVSEDMLALTLERVCHQMNLSIPEDISIIAFNNSLYVQLSSPQLTAIDINAFHLGQEAAMQIISIIDNPNLKATRIIVPHKIVERDSCRRI